MREVSSRIGGWFFERLGRGRLGLVDVVVVFELGGGRKILMMWSRLGRLKW